ncbi:MAG: glycogen-debranching protein [Nitrospiraceae bacterium]|nr:MAG: glycogen-debranching protein [Nitrospiraceae bacterium]
MKQFATRSGCRYPPGASIHGRGVNFSVFSQHATGVELLLYEKAVSPEPFQIIRLDPEINRTFFFWHVYVEDLPAGTHYTWRVEGPGDTDRTGYCFDRNAELLDPWARAVSHDLWTRRRPPAAGGPAHASMRGIVIENDYEWEGDRPLNHPMETSIIYELHVGGFTRHPSSGVRSPGTFAGLIEKIPYLKELGVTDVELLPVMAFDEQALPKHEAVKGLRNFWGYMTHSFFSPHPGYCRAPQTGSHQREFRDMVQALHNAGIGVILDVVFNHTAEGGRGEPVINFRGLCNELFYHLDEADRRKYRDYTGCGNTVNCNHPFVSSFIVSCLDYWVREMHVDGFRFDLASALARGEDGEPMKHAPVLWSIEFSDVLAHSKIIAEAWDLGGLYQVGDFPGFRWSEWNGRYRDVIRQFVRGEKGLVGEVATRISGSSDLYQSSGKLPINSINYVTCHDGHTLYDLVSLDEKKDEAARRRQIKNYMAILLLSQGVPMILAGDEMLRTQGGNSNAYCQDNEISWIDWRLAKINADMVRFVREMIALRKRHPLLMRRNFLTGRRQNSRGIPDVRWHGIKPDRPLWEDRNARFLAYTLGAVADGEEDIHVMVNMSKKQELAELPAIPGRKWHVTIDTGRPSPMDICTPSERSPVRGTAYSVSRRSVVVLEGLPR